MPFKILFVAATSVEAEAIGKIRGIHVTPDGFRLAGLEMSSLVAGVGSVSTSWEMIKWISSNYKPDLAINLGIAGSYTDEIRIGDVVMPITDCFADSGIEDGDNFMTLAEAGLSDGFEFPFTGGIIHADQTYTGRLKEILKPVKAITVNTATGSESTRKKLVEKFNPDIETMEGATFFYICSREKIPFLALRAVSNRVELRNKDKWDINLALSRLAEKLNEVVLTLK